MCQKAENLNQKINRIQTCIDKLTKLNTHAACFRVTVSTPSDITPLGGDIIILSYHITSCHSVSYHIISQHAISSINQIA